MFVVCFLVGAWQRHGKVCECACAADEAVEFGRSGSLESHVCVATFNMK